MRKIVAVPCDSTEQNLKMLEGFNNSLHKLHPDLELRRFDNPNPQDKAFWYRSKPIIAKQLMEEGYDLVIGADCDQIVTGDLSELWTGDDWDVAVVQNSNPKNLQEHQDATGQVLTVLDINPLHYVNAGLVVMRSKEFVDHWYNLCMSYHFDTFQFREQDLLNILIHYGNYRVKFLDASDKWYGMILKSHEVKVELEHPIEVSADLQLDLPQTKLVIRQNESWPVDETKQVMIWHRGGGANKPNHRTSFQPDVVQYLDQLIKPNGK